MMGYLIDWLWLHKSIFDNIVLLCLILGFSYYLYMLLKEGKRLEHFLPAFILLSVIVPHFIDLIGPERLDWSFYRLRYLLWPWSVTLLAFVCYTYLRYGPAYSLLVVILWSVFLAINIVQPGVLDPVERGPMFWVPEFRLYLMNAVWILLCYGLLIFAAFESYRFLVQPFRRIALLYLGYAGAVIFAPACFIFLPFYTFPVGEDPLYLFGPLSERLGEGLGYYFLGAMATRYLALSLLLTSMVLLLARIYKSGLWARPTSTPIDMLRDQLSGRLLEYFDLVNAGYSNEEIAEKTGSSKATVSRQLNNIKKKLELEESLRSFLKRNTKP